MGMHTWLIGRLRSSQAKTRRRQAGPRGDYHRAGGESLLHDVPITCDDIVIDAGGYEGDWTAAMVLRYGCRSEIYEPVPGFAGHCEERFGRNGRVKVHRKALGGGSRTAVFSVDALASSEFRAKASVTIVAEVVDVGPLVERIASRVGEIGCIKLNIEGGEYEVLDRLIGMGAIRRCRSLLVQFHRLPDGWPERLASIEEHLRETHEMAWNFPMVWQKWIRRGLQPIEANVPSNRP